MNKAMSHPDTERDERVGDIRKRNKMAKFAFGEGFPPRAVDDIDYLLSLLDSQAAESDEWRTVAEKYQALVSRTETDTATRMRDRCVEKVKMLAKRLQCTCVGERADHHAQCPVTVGAQMIVAIESLIPVDQKQ